MKRFERALQKPDKAYSYDAAGRKGGEGQLLAAPFSVGHPHENHQSASGRNKMRKEAGTIELKQY